MEKKVLVVNCGSKIKDIERIIKNLELGSETHHLSDLGKLDLKAFSHIILSASPILLSETDSKTYISQIKSLFKTSKPILGIGFGHQIIGLHFGAEIQKCKEDRKFQRIQQKMKSELFEDLSYPSCSFKEDHSECITLPEKFHLLASSNICAVEAMMHRELPIYGVQFHPELSGEIGVKLIQNFLTF